MTFLQPYLSGRSGILVTYVGGPKEGDYDVLTAARPPQKLCFFVFSGDHHNGFKFVKYTRRHDSHVYDYVE